MCDTSFYTQGLLLVGLGTIWVVRLNLDQPRARPVLSLHCSHFGAGVGGVELSLLAALPEVSRPSLSTMEIPELF